MVITPEEEVLATEQRRGRLLKNEQALWCDFKGRTGHRGKFLERTDRQPSQSQAVWYWLAKPTKTKPALKRTAFRMQSRHASATCGGTWGGMELDSKPSLVQSRIHQRAPQESLPCICRGVDRQGASSDTVARWSGACSHPTRRPRYGHIAHL